MAKYYKVGGYVRDQLLGLKSKDVDFAVEAESYQAMKADLMRKGVIIYQERPEFFTIRGNHPEYGGVDYVLCRKDGQYFDGRHPESVEAGTIYNDLARRDFTMNAIAVQDDYSIADFGVIDPYHGREDIHRKLIRCVGDPNQRFEEDALRILRAIRFAVKLDFEIERQTSYAMVCHLDRLNLLPVDRIREELHKAFAHDTAKTIMLLAQYGLIHQLFPKTGNLWLMPTSKER